MVEQEAGQTQLPCRVTGGWRDDRFQITVAGELDLSTFLVFDEHLRVYADRPLRVDLVEVAFIDSSGMAALLLGRQRADERGLPFDIGPVSDVVRQAMELAGVADLLA